MRRARVDAGLTISELAKRAGVSRDTISYAERGHHSLQGPTLSKIAHALFDDRHKRVIKPDGTASTRRVMELKRI